MPETYGDLALRVPGYEDEVTGADLPASFRGYSDSVVGALTAPAGQLLIAQPGEVARWRAMSGDATISEDGAVTIGDGAVTSRMLKPSKGIIGASEALPLTNVFQDVPGALLELTPAVPSVLSVTAVFELVISIGGGSAVSVVAEGALRVDGDTELPKRARLETLSMPEAEAVGATVMQVYEIPLTAAKHSIRMRARKTSGAGGAGVGPHSQAVWELRAA